MLETPRGLVMGTYTSLHGECSTASYGYRSCGPRLRDCSRILNELVALKRRDEARALIAEALLYARQHQILGAQTELLVESGLLSLGSDDMAGAEHAFREAAAIAEQASLPRMVAAAYSGLIDVYEARRNWPAAEGAANAALESLQAAEEIYDLPEILAKKAEVEAQVGRLAQAG
jgi:hypothetical protein